MTYLFWFLWAWFYVTAMHEVSHALCAWVRGADHLKIYPFWHWTVGGGRWYPLWKPPAKPRRLCFARFTYVGDPPKGPSNLQDVAPLISDAFTLCVAGLLAVSSLFDMPWVCGIFAACAMLDVCVWVWGFLWGADHTDGYRYRYGRKPLHPSFRFSGVTSGRMQTSQPNLANIPRAEPTDDDA